MSAPRVSIVLPTYNLERYVGQAIMSVFAQTEPSFELIAVDDASTDATRDVIRSFDDARLRLLQVDRNGGQAAARNRAISEARGEWVAILDADDWWAPTRLERLLEAASRAGSSIVEDDCLLIEDGASHPWATLHEMRGLHLTGPRLVGPTEFVRVDLGLGKPMVRRDFLVQHAIAYDESLRYVDDFLFALDCLLAGARILVVPEALYYYRAREGQTSSGRENLLLEHAAVAERLACDERVGPHPELAKALRQVARRDRAGVRYYELVRLLKSRRLLPAARVVLCSPNVLGIGARRLPMVLRARWSRGPRRPGRSVPGQAGQR